MTHVTISGTNLCVSRLSFGTGRLHPLRTSRARLRILWEALELGFTHFDTAPYYGFGIAERELGRFLKEVSAAVTVASKVGLYPPGSRSQSAAQVWLRKAIGKLFPPLSKARADWSIKAAERSLEETLRALRRDHVDILFLHEPDPRLIVIDDFLHWFERERERGTVRYWGLAGASDRFKDLIHSPIAQILQVRDRPDATRIRQCGRDPQFTYGALAGPRSETVAEALQGAFERNPQGSLIVSSCVRDHLRELAEVAS